MNTRKYERELAVKYAKKWALSRNPKYYNFDPIGGDCTSFVSQCLFAGSQKMNFNFENGWYYNNGYDKSPSWSGVEFLYKFFNLYDCSPTSSLSNKFFNIKSTLSSNCNHISCFHLFSLLCFTL